MWRPPSDPLCKQSISLVLDRFLLQRKGKPTLGNVGFLPLAFLEAGQDSCLMTTAEAFAEAYKAKTLHSDDYAQKQRLVGLYSLALKRLNNALSDPVEAVSDSTISAVWLLSIYEVRHPLP